MEFCSSGLYSRLVMLWPLAPWLLGPWLLGPWLLAPWLLAVLLTVAPGSISSTVNCCTMSESMGRHTPEGGNRGGEEEEKIGLRE